LKKLDLSLLFYLNEKRPHPARSSPPSPTGEGFFGKYRISFIQQV